MRVALLPTIVFCAVAAGGGTAAGQAHGQAPADAVTLDEAGFIAAWERADPRAAVSAAAVARGEADVAQAGVRANPTLEVEREQLLSPGRAATTYTRVTVPLDLAGRRGRRVAVAEAEVDVLRAEHDRARVARLIDGLRAFYGAAHAAQVVALLQADRAVLVRAVDVVAKRGAAGAGSGYELQRIELELAAYDDRLASATRELARSRAALGALLGVAAVDARSDLALPAAPRPSAALIAGAVEQRGDYRAAAARGAAADAWTRLATRGWIPELAVIAGAMATDGDGGGALGATLGVAISLPIFDRGQGAQAQARAAHRLAAAEQAWLAATVPAEIAIARAQLIEVRAQAEQVARGQLGRLAPLLRAAETGYREGQTGIVELLDAYRTARDTRLRELELRLAARLAELDLWLALGRHP